MLSLVHTNIHTHTHSHTLTHTHTHSHTLTHTHTHSHTHSHPSQLRELLTQTISHYVSLFAASNVVHLPQFKLQLCLESGQMEFYPALSDLESAILSAVHTVANAMSSVPDIQVNYCFIESLTTCTIYNKGVFW